MPISEMAPNEIWGSYIKYIGAGAVATGGIISLIKSLPLIVKTFSQAMKSMSKNKGHAASNLRTDQDMPMPIILIGVGILALAIWLLPTFPINLLGAVIVVIFGFFFATVSSRMVGLIGSSNNPVSGMAIATLLIATILLKATGLDGGTGMKGAIAIGSIICIVAAIAGDTSQDLKTGFIVGATPKKQQVGELIGVLTSSLAIGGVLYLLNEAWGYGGEELPAAQATMMRMIVEGVMNADLPWGLIAAGGAIAIVVEILRLPVLPFAVGMYLPLSLNAGIMAGGLVRLFVEKKRGLSEEKRKASVDRGILYTSGMIAGEGLVGVLLALLTVFEISPAKWIGEFSLAKIGGGGFAMISALVIFLVVVIGSLLKVTIFSKENKE